MTIRVAAIGVNHWHSLYDAGYLLQFQRMPDVQIVGVQDGDPEIAAHRAAAVGNPPAYTDYEQMLAELKPDFVLALGRPSEMGAIAHYLLDHGFPFIMEKPMGYDAEVVRSIAEKAAATGGFAAAPFPYRYQPQIELARTLIREGRLGPISHITVRHMRPTSARYPGWGAAWMLDPSIANGGCLRNLGAHGLDVFNFLVDEETNVIGAQISSRALGEAVDDYATVMLRSASGIVGNVEAGNLFPRDGTQAVLHVSGRDGLFTVTGNNARLITKDAEGSQTLGLDDRPSYILLRETLDRWQRGDPPRVQAADCYRAMRLVDQAYKLCGFAPDTR
ncbi:MAG: Gfo/Idh/MocA family oxidoreductase [Chloroflexi bacterium]|nr:Gfo/Idh/MocA family oxidoreductase [Chloroflexota bacterium]